MSLISKFPRQIYRYLRPTIADGYRYLLSSYVLERSDLINNPPAGFVVFNFGEDEYYDFDEPRHVGRLPKDIETKLHGFRICAPYVVEATNATLIGPSGIAFANGRIIRDSVRASYFRLVDASVKSLLNGQIPWDTQIQLPNERYDQSVFSLVGPWAKEYYHWLTDYLVRIFALETYRDQTGRNPDILIPKDATDWMLDSIALAGFDENRIIEWSNSRAEFSRFIIGSVRFHTPEQNRGYISSPQALTELGNRIRGNVSIDNNQARRLYVSRSDAAERRVRNEEELVAALGDYGFERIVPGEHSFEEQVRTFANAEIILGPHGGGLTNLIFAEETTLVELFGSYRNACYFGLARGMGHDYVSVTCQSYGDDIKVDVSEITSLLDSLV